MSETRAGREPSPHAGLPSARTPRLPRILVIAADRKSQSPDARTIAKFRSGGDFWTANGLVTPDRDRPRCRPPPRTRCCPGGPARWLRGLTRHEPPQPAEHLLNASSPASGLDDRARPEDLGPERAGAGLVADGLH